MEIRIIQLGDAPAIQLAAAELKKYLPMIDPSIETAILLADKEYRKLRGIRVSLFDQSIPGTNPELDDAIKIEVSNCQGSYHRFKSEERVDSCLSLFA